MNTNQRLDAAKTMNDALTQLATGAKVIADEVDACRHRNPDVALAIAHIKRALSTLESVRAD